MSPALSAQTLRAVARLATDSGRRVRFAMRGGSMLPLLREPMVLEVAKLTNRAKIGDVIVFACGEIQVVHRVVRYAGDRYVTSGDAQPLIWEEVAPADVLGRVEAVWEDGSPSARRRDIGLHRIRGWWCARGYPLRRLSVGARGRATRMLRRLQRAFCHFTKTT